MKFGLFFEISVPRPWEKGVEKAVYDNCIAQAVLADQLGYDYVWAVEHHFLEEYSHCSAPEVFLAAIAAKTQAIRIGQGIAVCVPEINHPARIAERAAVLDIISGGRFDLGTGRSSTWPELGGFRVNPDTTKSAWDEVVRALPKMWTQDSFSHDGVHFSMPERNVLPKPVQDPHPPMWVAVTTPGTELDAAERGMGAMGLTFVDFAHQEQKTRAYRDRIANCEPVGLAVNDQVAAVNFLYCHEDDETGVSTGRRLAGTFGYLAGQIASAKEIYPGRGYASWGLLPQMRRPKAEPGARSEPPANLVIGDPERCIRILKGWESTGVDVINFLINAGETVPHEEVMASLRLFATQVMPHFKEMDDAALRRPQSVVA